MSPQEFNNRLEALKNGPTENLKGFIELIAVDAFEKGMNYQEEFKDTLHVFTKAKFKEQILAQELLRRMGMKS